MWTYTLPVLFRYLSMALQFVALIFVTRRLSPPDAGMYFELFGAVNATYFLAGLGAPDGLVRCVAETHARGQGAGLRPLLRRAALATAAISLALAAAAGVLLRGSCAREIVLAGVAWWLCYGAVFFAAQLLVSLNRTAWGAFFFYLATSIALFVTSVPYLACSRTPTIGGTLAAAVAGALVCAMAALLCAARLSREARSPTMTASVSAMFRVGSFIALARVLQSSLYWIPVWAVGLWQGASQAATMGTASRLNGAIAAVMAAVRFTIRPAIVRHDRRADWGAIARESSAAASLASFATVLALVGVLATGPSLIGFVFGPAYRAASTLVAVLLMGTLGECIGGPVDEILKMTGREHLVAALLLAATLTEAALAWAVAGLGSAAVAAAQSIVLSASYAAMLFIVWRSHRVYVGAKIDLSRLRAWLQRSRALKATRWSAS